MGLSSLVHQKTALFVIGAFFIVVLTAAIIWGAVFLLRRSAGDAPSTPLFGFLTNSEEAVRSTPAPGGTSPIASPTSLPATPSATPVPASQNLRVTITFLGQQIPPFRIQEVDFVAKDSNLSDFDPRDGARFSVLKVLGESNQVLGEYPITMATSEVLESGETGTLRFYDSSTMGIILPISNAQAIRLIELRSSIGALMDSRPVSLGGVSWKARAWQKITTYVETLWSHSPQAIAQEAPVEDSCQDLAPIVDPETGETRSLTPYTIGITNEGVDKTPEEIELILTQVQAQVQSMVNTIEPWKTYAKCIKVTIQTNEDKVGDCVVVLGEFPSCPNQKTAPRTEGNVSILVHTATACDCGTTPENFPSYISVGTGVGTNMLAHLLGHATGKMTDEYLYQQNNTHSLPGKNCFPTENACTSFAGSSGINMQCTKGCSTVDEFRPSTAIMHKTFTGAYGSFEECILRNKLARAIGFQEGDAGGHINSACDGTGGKDRPQDPAPAGEYFGGRRVF